MTKCIIELHYLPCITYFATLSRFRKVMLERHEYYEKQTYRNRCLINTANGPERLTIPVTSKHGKVPITEVRIDYSQKWLNIHRRAIESAYRNAPYYEYYIDDLLAPLQKRYVFLYDLNFELLTICLKWLNLPITLAESLTYQKTAGEEIIDLRNAIQAKNQEGYANYFEGIEYQQVFGKPFVKNLSLVDLMFCEGPNALSVIRVIASRMNI